MSHNFYGLLRAQQGTTSVRLWTDDYNSLFQV